MDIWHATTDSVSRIGDAEVKAAVLQTSSRGDKVTWRTFFLPLRDQKKLSQTVPFELGNTVPSGLDEVVVDFQVLQRDGAGSTVLAAPVQREDLERHPQLLREGGADPKVVGIGPGAAPLARIDCRRSRRHRGRVHAVDK